MAFSGNCGLEVALAGEATVFAQLFAEELGLVVEVRPGRLHEVRAVLDRAGVAASVIGTSTADKRIRVECNGLAVLDEEMVVLRSWWEETSYQLERLQIEPGLRRCGKSQYL